ncbi:MAG: alpha-galactosidase, partial [Bacteroidota bacterium]|nr:alpha-galactosidase [Bacteroidota bacterium]
WFKPLADGSVALGILNRNQHEKKIVVSLNDIGLKGQQMIRNLWLHQSLGFFSGVIETTVPGHGVQLLKLTPLK